MFKLFTASILASTLGLGGVQTAEACGRCSQACVSAPSCVMPHGGMPVPAAAPGAPSGHEGHAMPASPQAAGSGTYRRFSYEPGTEIPATVVPVYRSAPAQRYSAPSHRWVPASELPKTDPYKYSGGRWK